MIFQVCRFFHLSHGVVFSVAAYLAYLMGVPLGWRPEVALPLAIIGASILGMAMEMGIYRPLRRFGASSVILLIASLGILIVIQNSISLTFGDATKTLRIGGVREGLDVFGAHITPIQIAIIVAGIVLSVSLWAFLQYTMWGKMTRAVASDSELSAIVGMNKDWIVLSTFAAGSALAAVAGVLVGYDMDLTPTMGFRAILVGVVSVIVGGIGSIPGALLGGLFVGLAEHLGVWKLPTQWQEAIVFIILILFLLFRPQGFLGKPLRRAEI